ncbi:DeoR/GlpR family DNA-binding transcription regulator [Novosphingobium sp. FKTRR1]|uniref:DeoR/GlpR family DNA-binding transcription regulator n=1 Tax=Novosphingobium sp. FKTRR1 TaxID=2879118 RepID=UPI001CF09749|nr:DeoR/GlpR family DNA-binding transcription regulator [Novosphingobium sp. FKTRR1]
MAATGNSTARRGAILERVRSEGEVDVAALASAFGVTPQTIRRDLNHLADKALLSRQHGGAALGSGIANARYDARRQMAAEAKARIGAAAAALVPEGASLFLNIGTTTEAVARHLAHHARLLVVTNNLNVVDMLAGRPGIRVIAVGGEVRASDRAVVGAMATRFLDQFRPDFAVIGASGLSHDGDLLDFDAEEVQVSRTMISHARSVMLVADSTKFGRAAPVRIAGMDDIDILVTDRITDDTMRERLMAQRVALTETG